MLACLLSAGGCYQAVYAQEAAGVSQTNGTCTGTVTDSTGEPMVGASVFVIGTNKGTSTDIDGRFSLTGVNKGATLRISSVGYTTVNVKWDGQPLSVVLSDEGNQLDEVVVVGYGIQKKVNLTGAVATVNGDVLKDRPITNIGQGLQGVIGNLNVSANNGGAPGATSSFNVRGNTSLNGGSPLVLVDNVQMDANLVNPNDIESVTVLKDAASAAIYGARAAYGVILITTKKGRANEKPTISFGASGYWSQAAMEFHKVNSLQYLQMMNGAAQNDRGSNYFNDLVNQYVEDYFYGRYDSPVFTVPGSNKYEYCGNTDWWDALYKTSFSQLYNLSINGGTDKTTYYASLAMTDQGTNRRGADENFKRYNASINVETKINNWLTVGGKISNAYVTQTHPTGSGNSGVTSMSGMFKNDLRPFMPVKHPDGNWAGQGSFTNPVAVAAEGGNSKTQNNDLWMTGVVKLTPIKNLFVQADYTWNAYTSNQTSRNTAFMEYGVDGEPLADYPWTSRPTYIYKYSANDYYQAFNAFAQYDWTLGGSHNFTIMTGYNQEKKVNGSFSAQRNDLLSGNSNQFNQASGDRSMSSSATQWSINSWFGRLNYNYQGKYLAEFVWRYDGSSKFPSGDRYGFFPSGSIGWRISEESFWEGMRGWWNNMKIRASYGRLGNQAVGSNFPYIANMNSGTLGYIVGGYNNRPLVVQAPGLVSATLTWEKVDQLDLGFDAAFLGNRLTAEFDWYQRDTKGMLTGQNPLPGVLGTNVPQANAADLRTTGWELALRWNDRVNSIGLNYYGRVSLSDYQAEITKFDNPDKNLGSYYVGQKIGEIWGYDSNGLFQTAEEVASSPSQSQIWGGTWEPGMTKYVDRNGDGIIGYGDNTVDNPGDRHIIGNSTPRYQFGITVGAEWKGFDFDMFWQGTGKRDYWFGGVDYWAFSNEWSVPQKHTANNTWTPENTGAFFPLLSHNGGKNGASRQTSTRYLQDASYGRLKSVMLGYTLPVKVTSKVGIERLRLYVQGENLLTITPMEKCVDPEILGNMTYPLQRKFTIGLNLTL